MKKRNIHLIVGLLFSILLTNYFKANSNNNNAFIKQLLNAYHFHIGAIIGSKSTHQLLSEHATIKKLYFTKKKDLLSYKKIDNNYLDFVYIDETYKKNEAKKIIHLYIKKIKRGGVLILKKDNHTNNIMHKLCKDQNFILLKHQNNNDLLCIKKQHKITFIIPCYNRTHTIKRAIDSIYQQNLSMPFEVVCTDDASKDNTKNILIEYEKKYSNFKALFHKENKGASETRNTCLQHSNGDLIFNLDSDNLLEPNSVEQLIDLLDTSGCDIAAFGEIRYFNKNKKNFRKYKCKLSTITIHNIDAMIIGSGNYLFTRSMYNQVGGYKGRALETTRFAFKKLAKGAKIAILKNENKNFYWHALSKDGKWSKNNRLGKNDKAFLEELKNHPELFLDEINKKLHTYNIKKRKISRDFQKNTFTLINRNALYHLFEAYWHENKKLYKEAINEYKMALECGCSHKKILIKLKELEMITHKQIKEYNEAKNNTSS